MIEIQLVADSGGPKSVSLAGKGGVVCNANVTDFMNGGFSNTSQTSFLTGSFQHFLLGSVILPTNGKLWVRCDFQPGAAVTEVDWTP